MTKESESNFYYNIKNDYHKVASFRSRVDKSKDEHVSFVCC